MKKLLTATVLLVSLGAHAQTDEAYQAPAKFRALLKTEKSEAKIKNGFAVFTDIYPTLKDLPLCLATEINDKKFADLAQAVVGQWNQLAQQKLHADVFATKCKKPEVLVVLDHESGKRNDGYIKFGIALDLTKSPKKVIVVRQLELDDFRDLLNNMSEDRLKKATPEMQIKLKPKFEAFTQEKLEHIERNLLLHELGHALGLAHNFNADENSIMNYSDTVEFSAYDGEALAYRFGKLKTGNWQPTLQPPAGTSTKLE